MNEYDTRPLILSGMTVVAVLICFFLVRSQTTAGVVAGMLGGPGTNPPSISSGSPETIEHGTIKIVVCKGYMVLAAGQIRGISEEQRFLLDTGTAPSILNVRTAKSMGLQITDTTIEAVGRQVRVGRTVLPEVEMGPIHVKSLAMNVADLSQWEELLGVKLAGLIGMDVLGRANFVLDYDSGKLELGGVPEAGMPVRYDRSRAVALADVALQGKALHLIVDTGSDAVVIYGDNWEGKAGRTLQGRSIAEPVATKRIKRTGLMVGKNYFSRVPIYCVPTGKGADNDGFLGVKALRLRGISFDREKQVLYLLD